ncbi:hypothetical protein [Verrucosispora sp. WMMC514]|uniref:hypothetical protein n=1 Tax=Verrucosispora sp. WMMC514 TaxID=3015156 RepID=UPI00248CA674|nr:hypothetical protein [Verrucosispora sp. WMMC514]WBB91319.1 hypothetical protein O7597_30910 [Verrucosispora sp. WMMC514]
MLFFLACVAAGVGLLILFSAGEGAGLWLGITAGGFLMLGGAIGGRWGRGQVARGVQAPRLTTTGLMVLGLCALAGIMLVWRPSVGAGLPMVPFLLCMAIAALLMVPVGLMGDNADRRRD